MSIREFKADLHIHSCLSPCGSLEMSPIAIVKKAEQKGLDIIAISDHNTLENVPAVQKAAQKTALTVLPAMEITSREEVHILAIFKDLDSAFEIQAHLYRSLGKLSDERYIEDQVIANELDEVEGFCDVLLMGASEFSIAQIVNMVHQYRGIAIAAHIDREAFGIIGQLGFIPPQIKFDALEVSFRTPFREINARYPEYRNYTFITNSDAHYIDDIGRSFTCYKLHEPTFDNLKSAIMNRDCYA